MRPMLIVVLAALVGLCVSVPYVMAADVGRYQIIVVHGATDGMVVVKLDTTTGKTWVFDSNSFESADAAYFKSQGMEYTSKQKDMEKQGWMVAVPTHWKEMPERPVGVLYKPMPAPK
jgi:hypothetical protein